MDPIERSAADIAECLHYLTHFTARPSGVPGAAEGTLSRQPVPNSLRAARASGLIPEAEYVTAEWCAESLSGQPHDVQAVLDRLVQICRDLITEPERLQRVVVERRRRFPGVLENSA